MKKPKFVIDCVGFECKDCVLNGGLCGAFQGIVHRLNITISEIFKTPEGPKPRPQFKRGDKVQVSDDGFDWRNRYFVGTVEGPYPFIAARYMRPEGMLDHVTGWRHCRPYKEE